jgi:RNA polymerase primary sigma factor
MPRRLVILCMTYHLNKQYHYNESDKSDPIGRFLTVRSRMAPPTKKECDELLAEMNNGSTDARKELIERHLRLVASLAMKYKHANFPMEDLMAEGIQGLIVALDKFDHTKGNKLSTYAAWWIRQRIQKALSKFAGPISVPHDVMQAKYKQNRTSHDQQHLPGTEVSGNPMKNGEGTNQNLLERIKMVPQGILSLDEPIKETKITLGESLSSDDQNKSTYRENGSLAEDLKMALRFLDRREKKVVQLRFGLGNESPLKLGEIAKRMKITAERVRQLEAIGLRKLRALLMQNGEMDFRKLDKLVGSNFRGKTKMSPLELILSSGNPA